MELNLKVHIEGRLVEFIKSTHDVVEAYLEGRSTDAELWSLVDESNDLLDELEARDD